MFEARIAVDRETDVPLALARLHERAAKHPLGPSATHAMLDSVAVVLDELKRQAAEAFDHGIAMSVSKSVTGDCYRVVLALEPAARPAKAPGLLSRLLGR